MDILWNGTMLNSCIKPCIQGKSAGSFPCKGSVIKASCLFHNVLVLRFKPWLYFNETKKERMIFFLTGPDQRAEIHHY